MTEITLSSSHVQYARSATCCPFFDDDLRRRPDIGGLVHRGEPHNPRGLQVEEAGPRGQGLLHDRVVAVDVCTLIATVLVVVSEGMRIPHCYVHLVCMYVCMYVLH